MAETDRIWSGVLFGTSTVGGTIVTAIYKYPNEATCVPYASFLRACDNYLGYPTASLNGLQTFVLGAIFGFFIGALITLAVWAFRIFTEPATPG